MKAAEIFAPTMYWSKVPEQICRKRPRQAEDLFLSNEVAEEDVVDSKKTSKLYQAVSARDHKAVKYDASNMNLFYGLCISLPDLCLLCWLFPSGTTVVINGAGTVKCLFMPVLCLLCWLF